MPYPANIVKDLQTVSKFCFCCGRKFQVDEYKAVHSATGLHLVLEEGEGGVRYQYRVTDPPGAYRIMRDRIVDVNEYAFKFRYFADAVCVCNGCHKGVHKLALELCRSTIPGFSGNTPTPRLLVEATFNYRYYSKPLR